MGTIQLCMGEDGNREQLRRWLGNSHTVTIGPLTEETPEIDLFILDRPGFIEHEGALIDRKHEERPAFVPALLIIPEKRIDRLEPAAWETLDEVIPAPIRKREFEGRLKVLLRARRLSLESTQRYHQLCQQMPDGVFILESGTVRFVNPAFGQLTGLEGTGMDQAELEALFTPGHRNELHELLKNPGQLPATSGALPLQEAAPAGWVEVHLSRITYWGEEAVMGLMRDVTERAIQQEALRAAKEEAEEMSHLKSALLRNMSHEIRTPLTSVIGYADLLAERVPSRFEKEVSLISESGERLLQTLDSVLDLSQLESGSIELTIEKMSLNEEIESILTGLRPRAEEKGLYLETDLPDDGTNIQMDRGLLSRVLTNLVTNAIKFTEEGGVRVGARTQENTVLISVEDTGIGMDKAFQDQLFEAFRQESSGLSRSHEGTGLGLAITKELVDLAGGTISVESEQGEGTRFEVSLPRMMGGGSPATNGLSSAPQWGLDQLPDRQRTLVVEDDEATRELITELLPEEHTVTAVATAEAALEIARAEVFDLVLLDINLTGPVDGSEVQRRLRAIDGYGEALIVAVTAYAMAGDGTAFHEEGFDGYIAKPFRRASFAENLVQITD